MRVHPSGKVILTTCVLALGLVGDGKGIVAQTVTGLGTPKQMVREEFTSRGGEEAMEAIRRMRPQWMNWPGASGTPVLYIDGRRQASLSGELANYGADQFYEMTFLDPDEAQREYGGGHNGGAIVALTRPPSGGGGGDRVSLADLLAGNVDLAGDGGARPRETEDTRIAERALDNADDADDPEEAQGHYREALTSAEATIDEDVTNPLGHRLAALAQLGLENYVVAREHFDHATELTPAYEFEDSEVRERAFVELYQRSTPFIQQGAYVEGAAVLENANLIYPYRPEALVLLVQLYAQSAEPDRALEKMEEAEAFFQLEHVAEVDDETVEGWRQLMAGFATLRAQIFAGAGRLEEAVVAYREMAAADPDNLDVKQNLATVLMQMGENEQALTVYEDLLMRPGLSPELLYSIGIGFYQAADYGRAAVAFGRGAEASPMDRDGIELWARSLQLDSAFIDVPAVAERWAELDPASQVALTVLAQAAQANGDTEGAAEAIGRAGELTVTVGNLRLQHVGGGVQVTGSASNQTLDEGDQVTLKFTFYSVAGDPIGTVTHLVFMGAQGMSEIFQVQFATADNVGGYGYELTVG